MSSFFPSLIDPPAGEVRLLCLAVPSDLLRADVPGPTLARIFQPEDLERYRALRIADRRAGMLLSRVLLRALVEANGELAETGCRLEREESGKPFLSRGGRRLPLHVNNSDTVGWVAWAFTRTGPLGCDVERMGEVEENVAGEVFAPEELAAWSSRDEVGRRLDFHRLWTLKESVLKADGRGLHLPLQSFRIELPEFSGEPAPRVVVRDELRGPAAGPWRLFEFEADSVVRGAAAVCTSEPVRFQVARLALRRWSGLPDGRWEFAQEGPDASQEVLAWTPTAVE